MFGNATGLARQLAVATGTPALSSAAVLTCFALWSPRLPARLATHFTVDGRAEKFIDAGTVPVVLASVVLGLGVFFGVIVAAMWGDPRGRRTIAALSCGLGLGLGGLSVLLLAAHLDSPTPDGVVFGAEYIAGFAAIVALGTGVGWLAAGSAPAPTPPEPPETTSPCRELGPEEEVRWERTTACPALAWVALGLIVVGTVATTVSHWWVAVLLLPALAALFCLSRATIRIDDERLTVRFRAGLVRLVVPVGDLTAVHSRPVAAFREFGGWGWRANRRASGLVLRSGPAIWLYRAQRGPLVITVADAEDAVALLNGLVARAARRQGRAST